MQTAKTLKQYRRELEEAMGQDFQRKALDNFVQSYRQGRNKTFEGMDLDALVREIGEAKDRSISSMDDLLARFTAAAQGSGATVHVAHTDWEANELIAAIARDNDCHRIVKSKSMTAEETLLNHYLEDRGLEVTETDLGEWIIQLRQEGPTHMVMPAIHLSRQEVSRLFTQVTGREQSTDPKTLVQVARRELRQRFVAADMGVTGANFAVAETGSLGIVTNEGNARLVTTLPRVHVALVGMDKLMPDLNDALRILRILPRNATGQAISSYVTWITGAGECGSSPDGRKNLHIIFLDNGRRALARDPVFSQALRCVRCGACAQACPVYRLVGGHKYGHIYIGAIGLILTYFFHGQEKARNLVQNCLNCQACRHVCAAGIDLPRLIKETQRILQDEEGHPLYSVLAGKLLKNRRTFHSFLRSSRYLQKPVTGRSSYLRHLPHALLGKHDYKELPALASKPFRDRWPGLRTRENRPRMRIALFSGCLQDFVYPEQLEACVELLRGRGVQLGFRPSQTCCGLPAHMLGEKEAASEIAMHNLSAIDPSECDYILTLCASCGSHLKENYPLLLQGRGGLAVKAQQFADRVIDLSTLLYGVLNVDGSEFRANGPKAAYHAPCHLCRGLGIRKNPRELLQRCGLQYVPHAEEETCCGLGGTYSLKFPEVSAEILDKKLAAVGQTGAEMLVTDCPGCILQLRGGAQKRQGRPEVLHTAEALIRRKL
jgi:iron-sulfur cluster protein